MKKLVALMMIAGMFSFVACGPSQEEKDKAEAAAKAQADSVMNAAQEPATEVAAAVDSAATTVADSAAAH